ncbi:MAG: sigma-70 family RNA polymerase sigma factor [Kiritimatiellaeota bacterium]|nr:sigma-70 family RNA polymerase sigma factor [Kiritimatiellota bacterium]
MDKRKTNPADSDGTPDVAALAQRAQTGCTASFEQLVALHTPRLLRFLERRTGSRHDAEDLVQETWARAYRYLHRFESDRSFPAWLWTIAARLDASRRRKKALPLATWTADVASAEPDAGQRLAEADDSAGLWALAARVLRPAQREALWLFYVEEMSVKDVAKILGLTTIGAKVLLHRARRRLGNALRQHTGAIDAVFVTCQEGARS